LNEALPEHIVGARLHLMLSHPFLASAVARLPVVNAERMEWCDTMATDGYYIYVNPDFCRDLDTGEIAFVFAHETYHCILGHMDRRGARRRDVWNAAVDYATNGMLVEAGLRMPGKGLYDRHYLGRTAEEIYEELLPAEDPMQQSGGTTGDGGGDGDSKAPGGFDRHVGPGDLEGQSVRAAEFPSPEERRRLRVGLARSVASKLHGRGAGLMSSEIEAATGSRVPWQQLLSRFISGLRRNDYRLFPFNKKHLWRGLYLPSIGVPGPDHLVVAIDTSGSMSDDILSEVLGELDTLRDVTECGLTLIQCDAGIHSVEEYAAHENCTYGGSPGGTRYDIRGRGGTDLRPPFGWVAEEQRQGRANIDALIYMTDGFGDMPAKEPPYPVMWVMPEDSVPDVPFGTMIRLEGSSRAPGRLA
jgi:predicted metal-dependent peptidase